MFGVVGDLPHRLVGGRQVAAEEALGVNHRALGPQLLPDRKRVFGPARIGMVEIVNPIGDGGVIEHQEKFLAVWFALLRSYGSIMSIAISGQLALASQALSSSPSGTEPSPISCALPNWSSSNSSGASDLQRACP